MLRQAVCDGFVFILSFFVVLLLLESTTTTATQTYSAEKTPMYKWMQDHRALVHQELSDHTFLFVVGAPHSGELLYYNMIFLQLLLFIIMKIMTTILIIIENLQ